jgi:hypothetical protein
MFHRLISTALRVSGLLALAAVTPAFSQEAGVGVPDKTRHQLEAAFATYLDALNRHDGKAMVALYAPGAVAINARGMVRGDSQETPNESRSSRRRGI